MLRPSPQRNANNTRLPRFKREERAVRRVIGSAASGDGSSAVIELQLPTTTLSLRLAEADLPCLSAAALSAYGQCRQRSDDPRVKHPLPAEKIFVERSGDDQYVVVSVTLVGGQVISFLLPIRGEQYARPEYVRRPA